MENKFDKDLKQRLGDDSLPEAGLRLDKDKLWGKIEKKKAKKRIAFLPWISHAAAVAAGLAAGIFLFMHKDQPESGPKLIAEQKEVPVIQRVTDTVYIVKNINGQTQDQSHMQLIEQHTETHQPATIIQRRQQVPVKETTPGTMVQIPEPSPVQTLAVVEARKTKVLHLIDMNNENAMPRPIVKSNFAFLKKYLKEDIGSQNPETFSMIVGKTIFNTKN